ncbi:MAG: ZIP family metal transporter [candidate division FCPU426 bacterium]
MVAVSGVSAAAYFSLGLGEKRLRSAIFVLVSFAVGALFGDVFLHLVPELFKGEGRRWAALWLLGGFLGFFVLEKFLRWRHCHVPENEAGHSHPVVALTLIGDSAHNLVDGMLIGAAWQLGPAVGLATSLAVFFHELPAELGHFGILMHGGLSPRRALLYNFFTALMAFVGLALALSLPRLFEGSAQPISAVAAGGFVYVAGSDLVPELHHELEMKKSVLQFLAIVAGIAVMAGVALVFG